MSENSPEIEEPEEPESYTDEQLVEGLQDPEADDPELVGGDQ